MADRFILTFVAVMVLCFASACDKATFMPQEDLTKEVESVSEETVTPQNVSLATIAIHSGDKITNVNAELAVTREERTKGLMWRDSIPKNYGMWFVFPEEVQDPFWMKDTLIPLDIIFVGPDMKVVDVIENAVPQSTDLMLSRYPYRYVLEVNAGFAADNGVKAGDTVEQRIGGQ